MRGTISDSRGSMTRTTEHAARAEWPQRAVRFRPAALVVGAAAALIAAASKLAPSSEGVAHASDATAAPSLDVPSLDAPSAALRGLADDPPTSERSAVPTAAEWTTAESVRLSRTSARATGCAARRVREWLRVRCPVPTFAVSLVGGSVEGLSFWITPQAQGSQGEAQFPLRRGDRRVVQLWTSRGEGEGPRAPAAGLVIQEHWIDGEPAPTVTVL
jgi:hypothetical protein